MWVGRVDVENNEESGRRVENEKNMKIGKEGSRKEWENQLSKVKKRIYFSFDYDKQVYNR